MWGHSEMEEVSDLSGTGTVREAGNERKCAVCLVEGGSVGVPLGEETTGAVLRALLLPPENSNGDVGRMLVACGGCTSSVSRLTDLFDQLEEMRVEFNALRRRLGWGVLVGWLGRSEEALQRWEEVLSTVETIYPSCVEVAVKEERAEEVEVRMEFKEEPMEEDGGGDLDGIVVECEEGDSEMSATVETERLEGTSPENGGMGMFAGDAGVGDLRGNSGFSDSTEISGEETLDSNSPQIRRSSRAHKPTRPFECQTTTSRQKSVARRVGKLQGNNPKAPRVTSKLQSLRCPKCSKTFSSKQNVARHLRNAHSNSNAKQITSTEQACLQCHVTFRTGDDLQRHILRDHQTHQPCTSATDADAEISPPEDSRGSAEPDSAERGGRSPGTPQPPASPVGMTSNDGSSVDVVRKEVEEKAGDTKDPRSLCIHTEVRHPPQATNEKPGTSKCFESNHNATPTPVEVRRLADIFRPWDPKTFSNRQVREIHSNATRNTSKEVELQVELEETAIPTGGAETVGDLRGESVTSGEEESAGEDERTGEETQDIVREDAGASLRVPQEAASVGDDVASKRKLACPSCPKSFRKAGRLERHRRAAHNYVNPLQKIFRCDDCSRVFYSGDNLRKHVKHCHPQSDSPRILCPHCDATFSRRWIFKMHQLRSHFLGSADAGDAQCPMCLKFFSSQRGMEIHRDLDHLPGDIRCFLCETCPIFATTEELKTHEESEEHRKKIRSKVAVRCNVCRLNFGWNAEALQLHLSSPQHLTEVETLGKFDEATFCVPCRQNFDTWQLLSTHKNTSVVHEEACKFREKVVDEMSRDTQLKQNETREGSPETPEEGSYGKENTSKGEEMEDVVMEDAGGSLRVLQGASVGDDVAAIHSQLSCPSCPMSFDRGGQLERHRREAHNYVDPQQKILRCDDCAHFCYSDWQLRQHKRHCKSDSPRISCTHCETTFTDPGIFNVHRLWRHFLRSTDAGDPQCPKCLKFFHNQRAMEIHRDKDHLPGDIRCFLCRHSLTFSTAEQLKTHEESEEHEKNIHSKRAIRCSFCRLNFGWNTEALRLHLSSSQHLKEVDTLGKFDEATFCVPCRQSFDTRELLIAHNSSAAHTEVCKFREVVVGVISRDIPESVENETPVEF